MIRKRKKIPKQQHIQNITEKIKIKKENGKIKKEEVEEFNYLMELPHR